MLISSRRVYLHGSRIGRAATFVILSAAVTGLAMAAAHAADQQIAQTTPASPPATAPVSEASEAIIVTGTRESHQKARESLSPVTVIGAAELARTGETDIRDALIQNVPALSRSALGNYHGSSTDAISLRGLNPAQALILVDGQRRHQSSDIFVDGPADGSTPVDIDMIPTGLIDHVEVLLDGAAAQYGSDALAGVINIILKKDAHFGTHASAEIGKTDSGDGFTSDLSLTQSAPIGDRGYIDLSAQYVDHNHTYRNTTDDRTGTVVDKIGGDPASIREVFGANAGYNFNDDVQFYTFDSYGHRTTAVYQLHRVPSLLPSYYPNGFDPQENTDEFDFSTQVGLRGDNLFGWHWDLSDSYGGDHISNDLVDSANTGLYDATGATPTAFHLSTTETTQNTLDFDVNHAYDVPLLPFPVNIALGAEDRSEAYLIGAGDIGSYEDGGSQSEGGLSPSNAGHYSRTVYSAYGDLSTNITHAWKIDLAGRYEHYSDFGSTYNGKISTRYEITPQLAVRGTVSNGTRAPSLADEHYSSIAADPATVDGTLATASPGAKALGATALKPERSTNFTAGIVYEPVARMHVSLDLYQIDIRDRILTSPQYTGDAALSALRLNGISISPTLSAYDVLLSYFTNGASTRNRGLDLAWDYETPIGNYGRIDWTAAVNLQYAEITHANIGSNGASYLNPQNSSYLTTNSPSNKVILGAIWHDGKWDASLHELRYGHTVDFLSFFTGPNAYSTTMFYEQVNQPRYETDLEIGYRPLEWLRLAVGGNNLFNVFPTRIPRDNGYYGAYKYDPNSGQLGIDGGYYYVKASVDF